MRATAMSSTTSQSGERTFDLLGLPRELRDMIIKEYLRSLPKTAMTGFFKRPDTTILPRALARHIPTGEPQYHNLLYACKQVSTEYLESVRDHGITGIFYISQGNIRHQKTTPRAFKKYWKTTPQMNSLFRHVEIELVWDMAARSLIGGAKNTWIDPISNLIVELTNIESLEFIINTPRGANLLGHMPDLVFERIYALCSKMSHVNRIDLIAYPISYQFVRANESEWNVTADDLKAWDWTNRTRTHGRRITTLLQHITPRFATRSPAPASTASWKSLQATTITTICEDPTDTDNSKNCSSPPRLSSTFSPSGQIRSHSFILLRFETLQSRQSGQPTFVGFRKILLGPFFCVDVVKLLIPLR
ncbi:hypothetical protein EJ08DRAFT_650115 [Tothia fuscella]|uniref:Uncharacterized protein n=1 Tax=Tothia fuscella TaxID=1048955 RepID=A0A9P4TX23_9PEZI|nr:hypothetical protein EJ08DRAFT_650115 [Tothia fuscella]